MTKQFEPVGDLCDQRIEKLREAYYPDLLGVTVGALFVFDPDESIPVLTHHGYPAAAMIRIVGTRDRAAGMADAQMVIDKCVFESLDTKKQTAVIDHELFHLERVLDKHGTNLFDALDRPRLRIRKHDWHLGWFDQIAKRNREHSLEVMQARRLVHASGQLYFNFEQEKAAA